VKARHGQTSYDSISPATSLESDELMKIVKLLEEVCCHGYGEVVIKVQDHRIVTVYETESHKME
jgi:hypothetical protein